MNLGIKIIIAIVLGIAINFIWKSTDAVVIDNQYHFTHNDIAKLYKVEMQLGDIIGTSVVKFESDVLYNLVISSIQKSILEKNGVKVEKENAITFVEKNNKSFKGLYQKFKEQMGVDDYYHLLIEPVAISETFLRFYNAVEPAKQRSNIALKIAQEKGLTAAANKFNQKIIDVNFAKDNTALAKEFLKLKKKGVSSVIYPRTIKIGNNIAVLDLNFKKNDISIKALVFKIVPYQEFLAQLAEKITMEFPILSWYSIKDVYNKKGSVL